MAISKNTLLKARMIAARVVRQHGSRYWPIFEVLDQEIEHRFNRENRLNTCLAPRHDLGAPHQTSQKAPD